MVERSTCHEKRYGYLWIFAMDICVSIPVSSYRPHNENLSTGFELRGAGSDPNDCIPESHDYTYFVGVGWADGTFLILESYRNGFGLVCSCLTAKIFLTCATLTRLL